MTSLILDINSLFHRSRKGLKRNLGEDELLTSEGDIVTGSFGTCRSIVSLIREYNPDHLIGCYDKGGNWRKQENSDYKENREKSDSKHYEDFNNFLERVVPGLGMVLLGIDNYEADDIICTLCRVEKLGKKVVVSTDKDMLSLISENVDVLLFNSIKKKKLWNLETFREKYGFNPEHFPLYKSILGDPSDNIKGLRGYGKVKTKKLLLENNFSLESLMSSNLSEDQKIELTENLKLVTMINNLDLPGAIGLPYDFPYASFEMMKEDLNFDKLKTPVFS